MSGRGLAGWMLTVAALAATACTTHREKADWRSNTPTVHAGFSNGSIPNGSAATTGPGGR